MIYSSAENNFEQFSEKSQFLKLSFTKILNFVIVFQFFQTTVK